MTRLVAIAEISELVSAALQIPVREIRQDCRSPHLVEARQLICWLARQLGDHSYPEIGRFITRIPQHHTTVLHAERQMIARMESDPSLALFAQTLLRTLEMLGDRNLLRVSEMVDPIATARRVMSNPAHHAMRVSTLETVALCHLVIDLFGTTDEPTAPFLAQSEPETSDAA